MFSVLPSVILFVKTGRAYAKGVVQSLKKQNKNVAGQLSHRKSSGASTRSNADASILHIYTPYGYYGR